MVVDGGGVVGVILEIWRILIAIEMTVVGGMFVVVV